MGRKSYFASAYFRSDAGTQPRWNNYGSTLLLVLHPVCSGSSDLLRGLQRFGHSKAECRGCTVKLLNGLVGGPSE